MIHAYDRTYLAGAQRLLARMLDYMVNDLEYSLETAWQWFLASDMCARFEQGDCAVLAGMSGVPVRTIQQYEQRQKDINKAQVQTLLRLARVLMCGVEDLMEKVCVRDDHAGQEGA